MPATLRDLANMLRERLETLRGEIEGRWAATERDVLALYTAQFGPREKGEKP